jgi:hypothetical protein
VAPAPTSPRTTERAASCAYPPFGTVMMWRATSSMRAAGSRSGWRTVATPSMNGSRTRTGDRSRRRSLCSREGGVDMLGRRRLGPAAVVARRRQWSSGETPRCARRRNVGIRGSQDVVEPGEADRSAYERFPRGTRRRGPRSINGRTQHPEAGTHGRRPRGRCWHRRVAEDQVCPARGVSAISARYHAGSLSGAWGGGERFDPVEPLGEVGESGITRVGGRWRGPPPCGLLNER